MSDSQPPSVPPSYAKLTRSGRPRRKPGRAPKAQRKQQQKDIAERRAKALTLQIAGATLASIAAELGYSGQDAVYKDIQRALRDIPGRAVDEWREMMFERYERFFRHHSMRMGEGSPDLDLKRTDRCKAILDRQCELLGVNAPVKVQHSGAIVNIARKVAEQLTDAELDELLDRGIIPERFEPEAPGVHKANGSSNGTSGPAAPPA